MGSSQEGTCSFSHEQKTYTTHTDTILPIPAACCGVLQDLLCSAPSLKDIPLKLAKKCLKTDPCFHNVLREKGEGEAARKHGETKLEIYAKLECVKGQTERFIFFCIIYSCLSGDMHWLILKSRTHSALQTCSPWVWNR